LVTVARTRQRRNGGRGRCQLWRKKIHRGGPKGGEKKARVEYCLTKKYVTDGARNKGASHQGRKKVGLFLLATTLSRKKKIPVTGGKKRWKKKRTDLRNMGISLGTRAARSPGKCALEIQRGAWRCT